METNQFANEKFVRLAICALSLALAATFFVPWVSVFSEDPWFKGSYSPLQIALGVGFPYHRASFAVFSHLAIPLAMAVAAITRVSHRYTMLLGVCSLLITTVFNMHFVFGMDYRAYATATAFFWVVVVVHVAILGLVFYASKTAQSAEERGNVEPPYTRNQKLTTAAMLLAMAVVIHLFAITLYVGGVPALRISFAGIFNNTTAILFGPVFGGIQRALHDVISHFVRPMGAFLWPITVVAFLRGVATGWMWLKVRNVRPKVYSGAYTAIFAAILVFGFVNLVAQLFFPGSAYVVAMLPREGQGLFFATAYYISSWGLIIAGIIGLVPQLAVYKLTRKTDNNKFYDRFIKFLVAVLVPGLFFNTVNTVVIFFTAVSPAAFTRGFVYFWAPRFFEELVTSMIMVYIMVVLIEVYEKAMKRKLIHSTR